MRKKRLYPAAGVTAAVVGAMLAAPSALAAPSPEPTPTGRVIAAEEPVPGRYIVVLKDNGLTKSAVQERSKDLTSRHGGEVRFTYGTALKGYAASMSAEDARQTAADARVAYVQQDGISRGSGTQTNPPSWGLDRVDQRGNTLDRSYTYPNTASDVTTYIVDSGIRIGHTQFEGRASIGANFATDSYNQTCMSHGTHVAGTVAGKDYGIAKKAKIVSVRVLNCNDEAYDSDIVKAVNWITEQAAKDPGRRAVVNMSINSGGSTVPAEDQAIKNSVANGVTWVVSSGNANSDACQNSPGNIKEAIVVNNATKSDQRRSDSNYGSCTDLFAPGTDIVSAAPGSDTATTTMSGTSMASPHVAGAAALYLSANPTATPAQVQTGILNNATTNVISGTQGSPNKLLYVGGGTTTPPAGPRFENTDDYTISDNATVTSPLTVTGVSGNAPDDLAVTVDIRHTYRGDLKVELVAPDGSAYLLKNYDSNDSADNVQATYTVNASGEAAGGTWKLRVTDNWSNDTGYINAWSLQF